MADKKKPAAKAKPKSSSARPKRKAPAKRSSPRKAAPRASAAPAAPGSGEHSVTSGELNARPADHRAMLGLPPVRPLPDDSLIGSDDSARVAEPPKRGRPKEDAAGRSLDKSGAPLPADHADDRKEPEPGDETEPHTQPWPVSVQDEEAAK